MSTSYLLSGHVGPLAVEHTGSRQSIANALAGSGLETIRLDDLEGVAIQIALEKSAREPNARCATAGNLCADAPAKA